MNKILALIDFTETSKKAVEQAANLASFKGAELCIAHIMSAKAEESVVKNDLNEHLKDVDLHGLEAQLILEKGDFMVEVPEVIKRMRPELVVVGTHGISDWRQNLLGSNIFKLVKLLPCPTLVINDEFQVVKDGFQKILLPVAPHDDYLNKVKQSANLLASGGEIEIFAIVKPGVELDDKVLSNLRRSGDYLDEQQINWKFVEEDTKSFSVGYSRETINYAAANNVDLIGIMAKVSEENRSFGTMDKENMLLNEMGISILCSNH